MVDKINKLPESEKNTSPDKKNKENPFRFEQQELASLRLSIEEQRDNDQEKPRTLSDKKERVLHAKVAQQSVEVVGLAPIDLQKRRESAQSVVTMVQDAKNDTGIVGVLGSWADRILHGVDV